MARLLIQKIALIVILLPLLSLGGFQYAVAHPRVNPYTGKAMAVELATYPEYLQGVLHGDFGEFRGVPVLDTIKEPLRNSLALLLLALAVAALLGPLVGVASVSRRTRRMRTAALVTSTLFLSMPGFFLGVAVIGLIIYATLSGFVKASPIPLSGFGFDAHLIMPVLVLASRPAFQVARVTANLLENELQQDYVQVARSKGLGWGHIFWRHAFRSIISPVVVTIGQSTRLLISALIIVETLFLWPGLGRLFMLDIGIRTDGRAISEFFGHPELLSALAVIFGALLLFSDLLASIGAYLLDPRQSRSASGG